MDGGDDSFSTAHNTAREEDEDENEAEEEDLKKRRFLAKLRGIDYFTRMS